MTNPNPKAFIERGALMLALVIAGELVYGLAFNVPRFFRPTMLEVFGINNTQLGDMFAIYGIAAMLSYFPGGAIADRVSARFLISVSLLATAAGGLYMATIPGPLQMKMLYGFWGLSTVFLFWGALIKTTRDWGGAATQGLAFGILDGGRGLVAALAAFAGVSILAFYLPENARLAAAQEREAGFQMVVWFYSALTVLAAVFAWFAIPAEKRASQVEFNPLRGMVTVMQRPVVWAQACIIVFAYCGYKGLDNYSLYAVHVLGMDEVEGARLASYGAWTRPAAALIAGLLADRFNATRSIAVIFTMMIAFYVIWSTAVPSGSGITVIYLNFFVTYVTVYALRGIYFALLEENRTPRHLTGAAVGLVSLVGYSPDVFFGPISGRILDANPGIVGFQNYLMFLAGIMFAGLMTVLCLVWLRRRGGENTWKTAMAEP